MWYRGTAAAKAVCCGSAARRTDWELTVAAVYVDRALRDSETAQYRCEGTSEHADESDKKLEVPGFLYGAVCSALVL